MTCRASVVREKEWARAREGEEGGGVGESEGLKESERMRENERERERASEKERETVGTVGKGGG